MAEIVAHDFARAVVAPEPAGKEIWKPIPGYLGVYEVSNLGRIRSVDRTIVTGKRRRGKVLKPSRGKLTEHQHVVLCNRRKRTLKYVHRAVLEAFVGPPGENEQGCHNDGDPTNNRVENLRWGSAADNMQDRLRHGNNPQSSRMTCRRGHPLISPNLVASAAKRGWRKCLACQRTHRQVEYRGSGDFQALSDIHFENIMRTHADAA